MGLFNSILGNASQVNIDEIKAQFENVLVENENIEAAFSLFRDKMVFTNKRIIFLDKQNVTVSKKEYLSVPYHAVSVFSVESAGTFDADAEIKLWVREIGQITKKVGKKTEHNIITHQKKLQESTDVPNRNGHIVKQSI